MITPLMLLAHILSILGFATYASTLLNIQNAWHLSNLASGFLASSFYIGYILVVPIATTLTDKMDARQVYCTGAVCAGFGLLGMGCFAEGFVSASIFLILHGAGVAATYMPGLKILADRLQSEQVTRHFSFYTAAFGVGTAASYFFAGLFTQTWGWRAAFICSSLGPFIAAILVGFGTKRLAHEKTWSQIHFELRDAFPIERWKKVLAVKEASFYMFGYATHTLELLASRSWLVAFLTYCMTQTHPSNTFPMSATLMATLINLVSVPASILGNEMALRVGRQRWVTWVIYSSALCGLLLASSTNWHWSIIFGLAMLHAIFMIADSATLTSGLMISTPVEVKGTAMGLHSLLGFCGGFIGPILFGACLDLLRSQGSFAWLVAYFSIVIWSVIFIFYTGLQNQKKHRP